MRQAQGRLQGREGNEGLPVTELYTKAQRSVANRNYDAAVRTFKRLVAQYPYGAYTEQALIETAYAQYKMGNNDDAISTIDRFLRTYPTHRNAAYLYYLRGLVNSSRDTVFLQRVWKLDASRRDLATPQQAYNDFKLVVERYPNSRYAADATKRMGELRDLFARHEIETALYYLRRGAWVAAIERAEYMAETYPQSAYDADGIAVKGEAYAELGNTALANSAREQLRQSAPQHPWLKPPTATGRTTRRIFRKLNPFASEKSALDRDRKRKDRGLSRHRSTASGRCNMRKPPVQNRRLFSCRTDAASLRRRHSRSAGSSDCPSCSTISPTSHWLKPIASNSRKPSGQFTVDAPAPRARCLRVHPASSSASRNGTRVMPSIANALMPALQAT